LRLIESPYLSRYYARERTKTLRANILFGLMIGWLLTLSSAVHYFVLDEGGLWPVWLGIGTTVLVCTIALPDLLVYPRSGLAKVSGWLGNVILKAMLVAVYSCFVVPSGLLLQKLKGQTPYYAWEASPPLTTEGWVEKFSSDESARVRRCTNRSASLFQLGEVIGYFVRHGELMLVPCLLVFLIIGLLVIFAQSSAVAPMIYTLF
jgi:hypothetical protein